jgi:GTP-binding protein
MRIIDARFERAVTGIGRRRDIALPEICLVGRSNVGKSSMLNTLVGRKIARTGSTPGVTRIIGLYRVTWESAGARKGALISDFPGFGYSKVARGVYEGWQAMVEGYVAGNEWIKRVLWVFDIRRDPDRLDAMLLRWLQAEGLPFSLVLTKADKVGRIRSLQKKELFRRMPGFAEVLLFSSKDGYGRNELLSHIVSSLAGPTS